MASCRHRDGAHNDFRLGATQFVQVEKYVWVANLIDQRGIGCGLAGGDWSRVEPLIMRRLVERGVAVTVYDHGE